MNTQREAPWRIDCLVMPCLPACYRLKPAFRQRVSRENVIDEPISRATHERDGEEQDVVPAQEDFMSFEHNKLSSKNKMSLNDLMCRKPPALLMINR